MRSLPPLATKDRVTGAVLVVACGVTQAAALALAAFATRDAFAALHSGTPMQPRTVAELLLSGVVAALCLFLSRRQAEALGQSYALSLRHSLYRAISRFPKSRHEEKRVGALSLRFVGDLSAARLWFGRGLPSVLTALVVLPGAVFILFALDTTLAVTGLVPLGLALFGMAWLAWHLQQRHRTLRSRRASIAIAMIERIAIAPELDLMGRTYKELRALDAKGKDLAADAVARRGRTSGLQAILQAGIALSGLTMLWFASMYGIDPATVAACLSVLALVALPLQELAATWDQFCAWTVAREKALRLLNEPSSVHRHAQRKQTPVTVTFTGEIDGETVAATVKAGSTAVLNMRSADRISRMIAGLDPTDGVELTFDGSEDRPHVAFIDDLHVGLQGSLRRTATLSARKRPQDAEVLNVLTAFGLGTLLQHPRGLDQRLSENGKGLTPADTLRLDLARAVLGKAAVIVISSIRWQADQDQKQLLDTLRRHLSATVIVAEAPRLALTGETLE